MSKSDVSENNLLKAIFNATAIANLLDNAASAPNTNLYFALHTADPGETGTQSTNECTYTSYARVAVPRSSLGFTVTANSVSTVNDVDFPTATGGSETATHFSVGMLSAGAGVILYSGALAPAIVIASGTPPIISKTTTITED
jgi:hypothetical protein